MRPRFPGARAVSSRSAALLAALVAAGAVLLYLAAYVLAGPGVLRGATVLGVAIGGQSRSQAVATLQRELADGARAPLPVRAGSQRDEVDPRKAGLALDADATVESSMARTWNPVGLARALVGGTEVEPVVATDEAALRSAVEELAGRLDREAADGAVTFTRQGGVRTQDAVRGVRLRRSEARDALVEGYLAAPTPRPVRLPADVERPAVDQAEIDRVVTEIAEPAVSAPGQEDRADQAKTRRALRPKHNQIADRPGKRSSHSSHQRNPFGPEEF
jgi:hypothetical protein